MQKSDFGGTGRFWATCFSIGGKGYVGTGNDANGYTTDFWEFDTLSNAWIQKANFAGEARRRAVGFSINTKGFLWIGKGKSIIFFIYLIFPYTSKNSMNKFVSNGI